MNIVPVLLVKNEELWIRQILTALANVFEHIIVSDTGSTDETPEIADAMPQVTLYRFQSMKPDLLTWCRQFMQDEARKHFDATHIFLIDGDELYPTKYLRFIADHPMADNCLSGFTSGIECGELENGEIWFYRAGLNRQAIIPVGSTWRGVYPFESPDCYQPGSPLNHYFAGPDESYRFFHLHHTRRSRHDGDVYLRMQKRNQFSMRDAPEIELDRLWLTSREEYRDE
jgi:glycosyltransferase involved in cell wall biosynthesis